VRIRAAVLLGLLVVGCGSEDPRPRPSVGPPRRPTIVRGPYLQPAADGSATVAWYTDVPIPGRVLWQEEEGRLQEVASTAGRARRHEVTLTPLEPETRYLYSVADARGALADVAGRAEFSFRTPEAASLKMVVFGDSGEGSPAQYALAARIAGEDPLPDLVLIAGDVVYPSGADSDYDAKFFIPYRPLLSAVPFYAALGNHDYDTAGGRAYFEVFSLPQNGPAGFPPEAAYEFERAGVQVVVHDSNRPVAAQLAHADPWHRDLAGRSATFRLAVLHHPPYSSGPAHLDPSRDAIRAVFPPLFTATGVDLALSGHDHLYERTRPIGGVVYVTTGAGGADLYPRAASNPFTVAFANERHSYTVIEISGHVMHLRQIDEDGREVDTVTLTKAVTVADSEALAPTTRDETHPVPVRRAQRRFRLSRPSGGEEVVLRVRAEGPFLVRLNEVEVGRGDGAGTSAGFTAFSVSPSLLRKGENTLAFEAHGDAAAVLALELTVFEENGRAPLGMTR